MPGGPLTLEGNTGMCHSQDPHFQVIYAGDPPAPETLLRFFEKNHFQAQFSPILVKFQLLRHKLKSVSETLFSSQEISSGDPTFENLAAHAYLLEKFRVPPPDAGPGIWGTPF